MNTRKNELFEKKSLQFLFFFIKNNKNYDDNDTY